MQFLDSDHIITYSNMFVKEKIPKIRKICNIFSKTPLFAPKPRFPHRLFSHPVHIPIDFQHILFQCPPHRHVFQRTGGQAVARIGGMRPGVGPSGGGRSPSPPGRARVVPGGLPCPVLPWPALPPANVPMRAPRPVGATCGPTTHTLWDSTHTRTCPMPHAHTASMTGVCQYDSLIWQAVAWIPHMMPIHNTQSG